jgi:hypothetical protein
MSLREAGISHSSWMAFISGVATPPNNQALAISMQLSLCLGKSLDRLDFRNKTSDLIN